MSAKKVNEDNQTCVMVSVAMLAGLSLRPLYATTTGQKVKVRMACKVATIMQVHVNLLILIYFVNVS